MQQQALVGRLHGEREQLRIVVRARAGGRQRPEAGIIRRDARAAGEQRAGEQTALRADQVRQALERCRGHATSWNAAAAASSVRSRCS